MAVRDKVFKSIIETFQLHGAVTIDTPVFERKVILKKILQDIKIFINFLKIPGYYKICRKIISQNKLTTLNRND